VSLLVSRKEGKHSSTARAGENTQPPAFAKATARQARKREIGAWDARRRREYIEGKAASSLPAGRPPHSTGGDKRATADRLPYGEGAISNFGI